jgi:hypothetical protein
LKRKKKSKQKNKNNFFFVIQALTHLEAGAVVDELVIVVHQIWRRRRCTHSLYIVTGEVPIVIADRRGSPCTPDLDAGGGRRCTSEPLGFACRGGERREGREGEGGRRVAPPPPPRVLFFGFSLLPFWFSLLICFALLLWGSIVL